MVDTAADRISRLSGLSGTAIHDGRIELVKLLGSGAYGAVYLGVNLEPSEGCPSLYAVKCLLRNSDSENHAKTLRNEMDLHSRVSDHPNIVTLHGVLYDFDYVYFILDYCPGGDMFTGIADTKVYARNDELIRDTMLRLLDALEHCHDRGIAHRDIKPENVLCNKDGSGAILTDFGLATEKSLSTNARCGTYQYMSPECIDRAEEDEYYLTHPSDVWSLGILLVNLLTGACPWQRATDDDASFMSYMRFPDKFFRHNFPLSTEVDCLLRSMLHPDPACRATISSARESILELETFYMSQRELAVADEPAFSCYISYAPKGIYREESEALEAPALFLNDAPVSKVNTTSLFGEYNSAEPSPATTVAASTPASPGVSPVTTICSPAVSGHICPKFVCDAVEPLQIHAKPTHTPPPASKSFWSILSHLKHYVPPSDA